MPMNWNAEADARLFACIMKVYDVKITGNKLSEVAAMMGEDCTAKALTHRLTKLRSSFTDNDTAGTPATKKTSNATPRKPASSVKKPKATPKTTPKNKKRKLSSPSPSASDDDDDDALDAAMPKNLNGQFDGGEDDDDDDVEAGALTTPTPVRRVRRTPGRSAAKVANYAEPGEEDLDDEVEQGGADGVDVGEGVKTEPGFEVEGGGESEGEGVGVKTEHPAEEQYSSHASPSEQLRGDDFA